MTGGSRQSAIPALQNTKSGVTRRHCEADRAMPSLSIAAGMSPPNIIYKQATWWFGVPDNLRSSSSCEAQYAAHKFFHLT